MEALSGARLATVGFAAMFAFASTGCATKKHVAKVVAPVEARIGENEKKVADNTSAIGELETGLSRADERAMDADKKAVAAGEAASRANEQATQAGQRADSARTFAEQGLAKVDARVGQVETTFNNTLQNLDNYKLVAEESVLFRFGASTLSKEAKEQLDTAVQGLANMRAYVVEVHGFTDRTGSKAYNLELSRKRANEVVHYLTVQHDIPLRRIHVIGVGSEKPAEEGRGRKVNAANRRVELKVFAPEYAVATGGRQDTPSQTPVQQPQTNNQ
jgi:outer membrane protein OmpA-like peptidoglycan-associated protein